MRVLVSVRDADEARALQAAGVDYIDLKEPAAGALGGLPTAEIVRLVGLLRAAAGPSRGAAVPPAPPPVPRISATIGDWPAQALETVLAQAEAVAACGVDLVKIGVRPDPGPAAVALLEALAGRARQWQAAGGPGLVPVLVADAGVPWTVLDAALAPGRLTAWAALMLDTEDKRGGSLLQRCGEAALRETVAAVRSAAAAAGQAVPELGLAGALGLDDLPRLRAIGPAYAGFRSAVCAGERAGPLCPQRLQALLAALRPAVAA
ncbi:MAG: hypothetical protein RLY78_2690 [Pseudomonadota bacterium]|jgi:uncharacterized protein (UPF0264 family)